MNGVHDVFLNWELNGVHTDVNGTENGVDIFSVQKSVHAKKSNNNKNKNKIIKKKKKSGKLWLCRLARSGYGRQDHTFIEI